MSPGGLVRLVLAGAAATAGVVAATTWNDRDAGSTDRTVVTRVVDGDTVETADGDHVRIIGIDTPERGRCGYTAATEAMQRMVEGRRVTLVNPSSVQDLDPYDRLLRFVEVGRRDVGLVQIREGRASARYDSRDGYDAHPREDDYRSADRLSTGPCEGRRAGG